MHADNEHFALRAGNTNYIEPLIIEILAHFNKLIEAYQVHEVELTSVSRL